jgi:hypothetical protein
MNIEELEREHEKVLLALEQEIEGWKSANRILKAHLEQAENALEEVKTATLFLQHVPPMGMLYDLAEINLKAIRGN